MSRAPRGTTAPSSCSIDLAIRSSSSTPRRWMPRSPRSSVPWASSSTSTAIRCNARDMARASRMIVRSGRLISGLEGNARTRRVNGGRGVTRPPSPVLFGVPQSLFVLLSPPVLLAIGALRDVRPAEPRARARVHIKPLVRGRRIVLHGEVEGRDARRVVLEVRRAGVREGAVHHAPEVLRRLPAKVVALVVTPSDEQVGQTTTSPPRAVEVQ